MKNTKILFLIFIVGSLVWAGKRNAKSNRFLLNGKQSVFFTEITTDMNDFMVNEDVIGYWDPTIEDIKRAQDIVDYNLNINEKYKDAFRLDSASKRQYWGIYDSSGNKSLYMMYIKDPKNKFKEWLQKPYWGIKGVKYVALFFDIRKMEIGSMSGNFNLPKDSVNEETLPPGHSKI